MSLSSLPKFKDIRTSIREHAYKRYARKPVSAFTDIAIHHSLTKTGSAEAYANYHIDKHDWPGIGYHFVIEQDGTIKYCNSLGLVSYHVGSSNGFAVGICLTGDFRTQEPTAAQKAALRALIAELKKALPNYKRTRGHNEFPGYAQKQCPEFDYKAVIAGSTPAPKPAEWDGKSFPGASAFKIGQSHPAVTVLGQRLVAHGFGKYYEVGPGPRFSEVDKTACAAFQRAQGWSGSDADGYPGPSTWSRLMDTAKGEQPAPAPAPKPEPKPVKEYWRLFEVDKDGKEGEQVGFYDVDDNARDQLLKLFEKDMTANEEVITYRVRRVLQ